MEESSGVVSLRERKVVLSATSTFPQQEFYSLPHNRLAYAEGKNQYLYVRQRRGARVTWWCEYSTQNSKPRLLTGDGSGLDERLELAHRLILDAKDKVRMEKFVALAKTSAKAGK